MDQSTPTETSAGSGHKSEAVDSTRRDSFPGPKSLSLTLESLSVSSSPSSSSSSLNHGQSISVPSDDQALVSNSTLTLESPPSAENYLDPRLDDPRKASEYLSLVRSVAKEPRGEAMAFQAGSPYSSPRRPSVPVTPSLSPIETADEASQYGAEETQRLLEHPVEYQLPSSMPDDQKLDKKSPDPPTRRFNLKKSASQQEWEYQKQWETQMEAKRLEEWFNKEACEREDYWEKDPDPCIPYIDQVMSLVGLEEVKAQFLAIKAKIDTYLEQDVPLRRERFNVIFQGKPGTGKTTVARLFASFMAEVGAVSSKKLKETSGAKMAFKGPKGAKATIKKILTEEGGTLFVDEAYQLTASYVSGAGRQTLDVILTEMENNIGNLLTIFVGYKKDMESFFEHNAGLASRIPYTLHFEDFSDEELWRILCDKIRAKYTKEEMKVEGGFHGLYIHIAIRRLGLGRGSQSFGNARAVENLLGRIAERQARRIRKAIMERHEDPDRFLFTQEDLIGPDPTEVFRSKAWDDLQRLVGLTSVKEAVKNMIGMIELNWRRELAERHPLRIPLNQVFVGSPGTGKTTVAKLYGQILADLGLLSRGEVVLKNPSDFIGDAVGKSEATTRAILASTVGKVLVIDEAYMLHPDDNQTDSYRSGVIDTIVAEVQGVIGEDRCIILIGYEDKLRNMFDHVNPGLSRRFPIDNPFRFENFTVPELEEIMNLQMKEQDLSASEEALPVVRELLGRALMRPIFSNAGEVESMLSKAKLSYEARYLGLKVSERPVKSFDVVLQPEDFDPDFQRGLGDESSCKELLGLVDESIIAKLEIYQKLSIAAQRYQLNLRELVPTYFIFKGPPGTGKTTTALHMGKIFYRLGFLSSDSVIPCTASDLIGQYVGQTVPKTRSQLLKALGKVLVIDEAHQLKDSHYAAEAVNELIQFLTRKEYLGRMVVILAGYTSEMNDFMASTPALSGLFPDEIVFEPIKAENCVALLARELEKKHVHAPFLHDPTTKAYETILNRFNECRTLASWSNAREIQTLAKRMIATHIHGVLHHEPNQSKSLPPLSHETVFACLDHVLQTRMDRSSNGQEVKPTEIPSVSMFDPIPTQFQPSHDFRNAPLPPVTQTHMVTSSISTSNFFKPIVRVDSMTEESPLSPLTSKHENRIEELDEEESKEIQSDKEELSINASLSDSDDEGYDSPPHQAFREPRVSNAKWNDLLSLKKARDDDRAVRSAHLSTLREKSSMFFQKISQLTEQEKKIWKDLDDEIEKLKNDEKRAKDIQNALQEHGPCENGFSWYREKNGWRCEGGLHFVEDQDLNNWLRE